MEEMKLIMTDVYSVAAYYKRVQGPRFKIVMNEVLKKHAHWQDVFDGFEKV